MSNTRYNTLGRGGGYQCPAGDNQCQNKRSFLVVESDIKKWEGGGRTMNSWVMLGAF